jgi:hypothetical protein
MAKYNEVIRVRRTFIDHIKLDNEITTWLFDVLQSIEEIESYFSNKPKVFDNYLKDIKTKRAVECLPTEKYHRKWLRKR